MFEKTLTSLAIVAFLASGLQVLADGAKVDAQGWNPSRIEVLKEGGEEFVRLKLEVDRGAAQLTNTLKLKPGAKLALKIVFRSDAEKSARDKGSWIFLRFMDAQGKILVDRCQVFEKTSSWKSESVELDAPAEATSLFMSVRMQQKAGSFDIKSLEITSDGAPLASLSPETMAALAWLSTLGKKCAPDGEPVPESGEIFKPFLKDEAPRIVKELGTQEIDGVVLRKVLFRSLLVDGEPQDVFAFVARPAGETGKLPGLLSLHGGWGCADAKLAVELAKNGYAVVAPDLPGIGSPEACVNSSGPWRERWGKTGGLRAKPSLTWDPFFDAVAAGLEAFSLLASQENVDKERLGITGISMGAYTTTMLCGLLGERVKAAYVIYGCGFYERGSEWTATLMNLPDAEREIWLANLDAGRRAPKIKARFFIAAAAKDHFFWPPAVNSTLLAMPEGLANHVYAPVASHQLTGVPQHEKLRYLFLNFWLKGEGKPFPKVEAESCLPLADGSLEIVFSAEGPLPVENAALFVSKGNPVWENRVWEPIQASALKDGKFRAVIPAELSGDAKLAWCASVSDARPATASSFIYTTNPFSSKKDAVPVGIPSAQAK